MRALFLIPGDSSRQLQAFAAVAAVAEQLGAEVQVVCPPASVSLWALHGSVSRAIPFNDGSASLADWTNLLGGVREPDFQLCINRLSGRQVDLMLSMSHIPTRVAEGGFSATSRVQAATGLWPGQAWQPFLAAVGVKLDAGAYRLAVPGSALQAAAAQLPPGDGPLLLKAPAGGGGDWPPASWNGLPARIRSRLPGLRCTDLQGEGWLERAARLASADVVLASDPAAIELAVLLGVPLVALGRSPGDLPSRDGVQGLNAPAGLAGVDSGAVLAALGLA